jgi:hypothetical protein
MPEIMNVKELLSYQNGAIVSKTLVEKETGTVTLFAFDKDQALSEHTTPFDALVQVTDGQAEIRIAGEPQSPTARLKYASPVNPTGSGRARCSLCRPTSPTPSRHSPRSR